MELTIESEEVAHPRMVKELVGHQHAISLFSQREANQTVPHAWLLSGPSGIGKASLAYHMAGRLLSQERANGQELLRGASHPDCYVIERENHKEIPVSAIRDMQESMRMTAALGGWRVIIIDGADGLNRFASNALLKILEEPLPKTILLLTTSHVNAVSETIRSRCLSLTLSPLTYDELFIVLEAQHTNIGGKCLKRWYHLVGGRPGLILRFQGFDLEVHYRVVIQFWNQKLPLYQRIDAVLKHFGAMRHDDQEVLLRLLLQHSLAAIIEYHQGVEPVCLMTEDMVQKLEILRTEFSLASWLKIWENLTEVLEQADRTHVTLEQYLYQIQPL